MSVNISSSRLAALLGPSVMSLLVLAGCNTEPTGVDQTTSSPGTGVPDNGVGAGNAGLGTPSPGTSSGMEGPSQLDPNPRPAGDASATPAAGGAISSLPGTATESGAEKSAESSSTEATENKTGATGSSDEATDAESSKTSRNEVSPTSGEEAPKPEASSDSQATDQPEAPKSSTP
jgi:hypothetical protein